MAGMTPTMPNAEIRVVLFERLAERLRQAGANHPDAAAVALVARGDSGLDQAEFAQEIGCAVSRLIAIERGEVEIESALSELADGLPDDISALLRRSPE
jgi:transcriptional regulator with XRE-family HTH domain